MVAGGPPVISSALFLSGRVDHRQWRDPLELQPARQKLFPRSMSFKTRAPLQFHRSVVQDDHLQRVTVDPTRRVHLVASISSVFSSGTPSDEEEPLISLRANFIRLLADKHFSSKLCFRAPLKSKPAATMTANMLVKIVFFFQHFFPPDLNNDE
jgi:hypothetical protein